MSTDRKYNTVSKPAPAKTPGPLEQVAQELREKAGKLPASLIKFRDHLIAKAVQFETLSKSK
jgi:hypothetical protein